MNAFSTVIEELVSDAVWDRVALCLPTGARTGRPRANDRRTVAAVLHVLGTGCRWCDLPRELGSYVTAWRRYRDWTDTGVWSRVWRAYTSVLSESDKEDWARRVSTNPRARQTGVLEGREIWTEPEELEDAIDALVEHYDDGAGVAAVMLSNEGLDLSWGL